MHISVTREDITNGIRTDGRRCPVALAIQRQIDAEYIFVGNSMIIIDNYFWQGPDFLDAWLSDFDEGNSDLEPIEFDIVESFIWLGPNFMEPPTEKST